MSMFHAHFQSIDEIRDQVVKTYPGLRMKKEIEGPLPPSVEDAHIGDASVEDEDMAEMRQPPVVIRT